MRRDLNKILKEYKANEYYELDLIEFEQIAEKDKATAIYDAFKIGYVLGQRATKAEQKKAQKKTI